MSLKIRGEEVLLEADPVLVSRILRNLFENALRYASRGTVLAEAQRVDGRVTVGVADEGPGVPPGDLERLFEPLFRVDRSRSTKAGGVGLGLMIVQRAVEAHGGQVRAENRPEGGLAVVFDLPLGGVPKAGE